MDSGQCGYDVGPIKALLLAARSKFHDLLSSSLVQLATSAVTQDDMHPVSYPPSPPLPPAPTTSLAPSCPHILSL